MKKAIEVQILRDCRRAAEISAEWTDLWNRCPDATTFQRPEWLLAWMRTFQPYEPLIILMRHQGRLVGFAPLLIYLNGSERVVGLMGGGISDYLDILVDPRFENESLAAIGDSLESEQSNWSALNFSDLPRTAPLLRMKFNDCDFETNTHDVCLGVALPSDVHELRTVVPGRQLRNLRNARARLERAGGGHILLATQKTVQSMLEAMFRLHGTRWSRVGESGVLCDSAIQSFHRYVAPALLEKGVLRLYGLQHKGQLIASLYALFENKVVYCYLQAFDPDFGWLSPGTQILGAVIEDAVRLGKGTADFLRGNEAYKDNWGARAQPTFRINARRPVRVSRTPESRVAA